MELAGANVVITGAASGIGAALAAAIADAGADHLWLADLDADGLDGVAAPLGDRASTRVVDVANEEQVRGLVAEASGERPIDLFCANAGIATGQGLDATTATWERIWSVNVLSHVFAARACLPHWLARGEGHLMITASAAGLLTNLGDAPYTATKHAAVGLAEWIAITHGDAGIRVSCLCPQGVRTPMVTGGLDSDLMAANVVEAMGLISPEACAAAAIEGLTADQFLILPHPEVAAFQANKAADPERWIGGMRKLQRRLLGG